MKKAIIAGAIVLAFAGVAFARTITVGLGPGYDFNTIQAAIDDSNDGDVVIVAPGTYTGTGNRDIDFLGKPITVRSTAPTNSNIVAATIIDCNGTQSEPHRGFYFHSSEDGNSVLEGFTVTNGYYCNSPMGMGGAILCISSSMPTIRNCMIIGNRADEGGGIHCYYTSPRIINCTITNNTASYAFGGGIMCWQESSPTITGCIIANNYAKYGGGGIYYDGYGNLIITNCTIIDNSVRSGDNGIYIRGSKVETLNCIIWNKISFYGILDKLRTYYCDIKGSWSPYYIGMGNIYNEDPHFVNPDINDFHLLPNSPCINMGDPTYVSGPNETDIDNEQRIIGGRVDIGMDEYCFVTQPLIEVWPAYMGFTAVADTINPAPQTLNIRNIGVDTSNWQITEDCDWLSVWPTSGQSAGETNEVVVSIDANELECGEYNCILTISDSNALNTPQYVNVDLYVGTPIIGIDTNKISIYSPLGGPNPAPEILPIWNDDVGVLDWQITENCDWLDVSPASGQSSGEVNEVTISVDADDLEYGIYDCPITIYNSSVPNDIQTVNVKLYCGVTWDVPSEYPTIQEAIDAAVEGGTVLVAPGTYKGEGNRDLDFRGKAVTVRSESGPQSCIIDCNGTEADPHHGFYFHSGENSESVLDGFTITNGGYYLDGGGIHCINSSPRITNCIISGNSAKYCFGGGIHCENSSPAISNCTISGNTGSCGGGIFGCGGPITNCLIIGNTVEWGSGAGLYDCTGPISHCTITNNAAIEADGGGLSSCPGLISNCTISGNSADYGGGGLYGCDGPITDCIITGNIGYANGGGLWGCYGTVSNCTITGNGTRGRGGGLEWCNGSITNCNISGNWSQYGGGLSSCFDGLISNCTIVDNAARFGGGALDECDGTITNCIIWSNNDTTGAQLYGCSEPTFSCIQNWTGGGEHNINNDPCFIELGSGYWDDNNTPYHWDDFWVGEIGDYHLLPNSPCIDTGDPNYIPEPNETDLDGLPRVIGGRIDMGTYEFNYLPIACIVGGDQFVEADSICEALIVLDGSCSSDEDSTPGTNDDINDFDWYEVIDPCDPDSDILLGSGEAIECNLPVGVHNIILEVTDKAGASDSNEITITVEDGTPPEFSLSVEPNVLWPVNHKMIEITPVWEVSDNCDEDVDVSLVGITVEDTGNTGNDIQTGEDGSIYLRAERSGKSSRRVYTITYQAVDDSNNVATASAMVTVPHDRR